MSVEAYLTTRTDGSRRTLHATRLLALGDDVNRFEAAVLLHEAARIEARALTLLHDVSPATRLRSAVEICGRLIDGLDPLAASRAWGEVLVASEQESPDTVRAVCATVDAKYPRQARAFEVARKRHDLWFVGAGNVAGRRETSPRSRKKLPALLKLFPGVADFWMTFGWQMLLVEGDLQAARSAVDHARRLEPDVEVYRGVSAWLVSQTAPNTEATAELDALFAALPAASPDLAVLYALGEIALWQHGQSSPERVERALQTIRQRLAEPSLSGRVRHHLEAARLFLEEARGGHGPSEDLLYRADLATSSSSVAAPLVRIPRPSSPTRRPSRSGCNTRRHRGRFRGITSPAQKRCVLHLRAEVDTPAALWVGRKTRATTVRLAGGPWIASTFRTNLIVLSLEPSLGHQGSGTDYAVMFGPYQWGHWSHGESPPREPARPREPTAWWR